MTYKNSMLISAEQPNRTLILMAITGFNLCFTSALIGLTYLVPVKIASYLAHMTILVIVFLAGSALVYDRFFSNLVDRAISLTMILAYTYAYTVIQASINRGLPAPPEGFTIELIIAAPAVIALAAASSGLVRWIVWSEFRLRITGM